MELSAKYVMVLSTLTLFVAGTRTVHNPLCSDSCTAFFDVTGSSHSYRSTVQTTADYRVGHAHTDVLYKLLLMTARLPSKRVSLGGLTNTYVTSALAYKHTPDIIFMQHMRHPHVTRIHAANAVSADDHG